MRVTATATRSGDWWAIEVPQTPGVFTQAKRLDQVAGMTADAVATMLDIDASDVEVDVVPVIPEATLHESVAVATSARKAAIQAEERASASMRGAVRILRNHKFSTRDIGAMLGVSHQRVSQLEKRTHS